MKPDVSHLYVPMAWQNHLGFVREATNSFSPRLARGRRSTASLKGDNRKARAENVRDMLFLQYSQHPRYWRT